KLEGFADPDLYAEFLSGSDSTETYRVLYSEIDAAQTEWYRGVQQAEDALFAAVEAAGLKPGSKELAKMSRVLAGQHGTVEALASGKPALRHATRADIVEVELPGGRTLRMTPAERMYLLASLQDLETRDLIV